LSQLHELAQGRAFLVRVLVIAIALIVAACNNGGGGAPAY
jgi:hypothetical protein